MNAHAHVWPCFRYTDAPAAIAFLTAAFGFVVAADYRSADDPNVVEHAELHWPHGGGVMLGSIRTGGSPLDALSAGSSLTYLVCDDPDALHERAVGAGAEIIMPLTDQPYGSRDFMARDPDGNIWSFGTYGGTVDADGESPSP